MERNEMENVESEKNTKRINKSRSTPLTTIHNHLVYVNRLLHLHNLRYSHYARCCKGEHADEEEEKKKIDCFVHTRTLNIEHKGLPIQLVEMALTTS